VTGQPHYVEVTFHTDRGRRSAILRDPVVSSYGGITAPWSAMSGPEVDDEGCVMHRHRIISTDVIESERVMVMDEQYGVLVPVEEWS
jgi:hypothetical protein